MLSDLISRDVRRFTPAGLIRVLLVNAAINTLIALLLTAIGFGGGFVMSLIFSQCIGMSIFLANVLAMPLFERTERPLARVSVVAGAVLLGALAGTLLGAAANGLQPLRFLQEHSAFFGRIVLIGLLFGGIISYVFLSLGRINEEKLRRLEAEKSAVEAELRLVQSQMEPHFLFNTLANIRSLIDADPHKAGGMLETFVAFLRSSLRASRERTVTLAGELDAVRSYFELFAMRMGGRLAWRIDLPDGLREVRVPPLLVQPLVENAIKHGLERSVPGGEVSVSCMRADRGVRIVVADTGKGMNDQGAPGGGTGLENVRKRLRLLYGDAAALVIEENSPSGVKVTVEIPEQ